MNWLGRLVAPRVRPTDKVLDLGCGILQPFGGIRLPCRAHVCVDTFRPYLDKIGPPTLCADAGEVLEALDAGSFDVVLLLDVVEHLDKPEAVRLIAGAERVARRLVIVFTPDGLCPQPGYDAWGMGHNEGQAHRCEFSFDELRAMGYACSLHPNGTEQNGPVTSVFGWKAVGASHR